MAPPPFSVQTLFAALALQRQGRLDEADALYRQLLRAQPKHFDALHFFGILKLQRGLPEQGIKLLRAALKIKPDAAEAHLNLGLAQQALNRPAEALRSFERAVALRADYPEALYNRGNALHLLKRPEQALDSYQRALALKPDFSAALSNRGNVLRALGRIEEALASYDQALALVPDFPEILNNRGIVLRALAREEAALASFDRALALAWQFPAAHNNRGNALLALGRPVEALASFAQAVALKADYADAINNQGNALQALNRQQEALACFDRALQLDARFPEALNNKGSVLMALNRPAEALASLDGALALRPDYAEALNNRGSAWYALRRHDKALADFGTALALQPGHAEARFHAGIVHLRLGQFSSGWPHYDLRWQIKGSRPYPSARPLWRGDADSDIGGKTLLVHAEQGLGDTLHFCRYVPMLRALGAKVILQVQPALLSLLSTLPGVDVLIAQGDAIPDHDFHCPVLSLPRAFRTDINSIPAAVPYLHADAGKVAKWRLRLAGSPRRKIGIVCSGNAEQKDDHARSVALASFLPVLQADGDFYLLQKDLRLGDEAFLASCGRLTDLRAELGDFSDTAAVVECMDLVITVCTSMAHLAGALGKPLWVLLSFSHCWRWLLDREDSPWYPSARLFRQPSRGDWPGVMARVAEELSPASGRAK